jgi:hypothetical protein
MFPETPESFRGFVEILWEIHHRPNTRTAGHRVLTSSPRRGVGSAFQPVVSYLVPPFLPAALSGYAVQRWKGRGDYVEKRLDEFCDLVAKTADEASGYWRNEQTHPDTPTS